MTYFEGFVGRVKCILVCEWIYMHHLPTCPWWWWLTLKGLWDGWNASWCVNEFICITSPPVLGGDDLPWRVCGTGEMHPGVWMNLYASPPHLSLVVTTYFEGFVGRVKCILVCEWIYMHHLPTCPWWWWWLTLKSCWTGESHSGEHLWWHRQLCYYRQRHHQCLQIHQSAVASGCASWRWAARAIFPLIIIIHSTSVGRFRWGC